MIDRVVTFGLYVMMAIGCMQVGKVIAAYDCVADGKFSSIFLKYNYSISCAKGFTVEQHP